MAGKGKLVGALVVAGAGAVVVAQRRRERADSARPVAATGATSPGGLAPDESVFEAIGDAVTIETSDGARLAARVAGRADGPVVVLTHGWTNRKEAWAPVTRRLVDRGYRVIAWDQRGHGESTMGRDEATMSRLGADLQTVLEHFDVRDAVLAGHSMGGMATMGLIVDRPDVVAARAKAAVLVATAAAGMSRGPRVDRIGGRVVGSQSFTKAARGRAGGRMTRGAIGADPQASHLRCLADMIVDTPPSAREATFFAIARMDLTAGLATCPVPTWVLSGTRDQVTKPRLAKDIAAAIPGSRFVPYKGAGHMLQWERPDEVAAVIAEAATAPVGTTAVASHADAN